MELKPQIFDVDPQELKSYYNTEGISTSKCCYLVKNILITSHFLFASQIITNTLNIFPEKLHLRKILF
jgi:hypothetical protein